MPIKAVITLKTSSSYTETSRYSELLKKSLRLIEHRGPDGSQDWVSADGTIGLGHCRLAINDLSRAGSQPMHSDDGKVHAVVIGEIYEYDKLRQSCKDLGYNFASHSDSELILALYTLHGAPDMFNHLRGEFSFVVVDERRHTKRVIAARDRFGVKPLFWSVQDDRICFAPEAKAFLGLGWTPEWDVDSIVSSKWLASERTMFKGVQKLLPGYWMEVNEASGISIRQYWDQQYPSKNNTENRSVEEMVLSVRELLVDAVRVRLRADVPIGIYLSGGIDSSAVAGILRHLVREKREKFGSSGSGYVPNIKCFTVAYPDSAYDESEVVTRTAEALGINCFKRYIDEKSLADDFENAVYHAEHHNFDLNSVAKYTLSSLAQEHGVKVVLSGEGSDDLFGGYAYFASDFLRDDDTSMPDSMLSKNPEQRRKLQSRVIQEIQEVIKPQGVKLYCGPHDKEAHLKDDMTLSSVLSWFPRGEIFEDWVQADQIDMRTAHLESYSPDQKTKMQGWHPLHKGLYTWTKSILANIDLTCLGDRSEMGHSIEGRPPFLDHCLAEYVNSLPPGVKMRHLPHNTKGLSDENASDYWWKDSGSALQSVMEKWILREAVRPFITEEIYHRRKLMFLAPIRWSRDGPLHTMFRKILTQESVSSLGFVSWHYVESALERGFGEAADGSCFRAVLFAASWVTLSKRFGVRKATMNNSQGEQDISTA
ncbi:hypothetical protein QQS21_012452 [Conoideocrella luteorostrata]|uniref:Glutamine amidotransferase type-2 domain-containing protein n=1 Tax=Conoideocrella luteorostrata TaxID=1105319 RepID=A0AAJ0CB60_9HYPO|nr:hypothetical protein QQS21_012452 [Conoideocrella luteorostrata]